MALWPFKKRRTKSTAEGKQPAVDDLRVVQQKPSTSPSPPRCNSWRPRAGRRSNNGRDTSSATPIPEFPLPPSRDAGDSKVQTQEQQQPLGSSPYPVEQNQSTASTSSNSSHRPHKQPSIIRRFSKRKDDKNRSRPPSAYQSRLDRQNSRLSRDRAGLGSERPVSGLSVDSQMSSRAYKIRLLDMLVPHPTLHYDDRSLSPSNRWGDFNAPGLVPSRSNSRRTNSRGTQNWRYKSPMISEERMVGHDDRVDDLADELDEKGLREAMERDQRRREKKRKEYEERLRSKLEKKMANQQSRNDGDDREIGIDSDPDRQHRRSSSEMTGNRRFAQQDPRVGYAVSDNMGTQTPLSWFHDGPSMEDLAAKVAQFAPRPEVATPVSMDFQDERPSEIRYPEANDTLEPPSHVATVVVDQEKAREGRVKTSAWTSFIKRATAARIKKEHASRAIRSGESTLLSDSEGDDDGIRNARVTRGTYLEVGDLRHQGQTPGRHVSNEIVLAMNAVETGHIREQRYKDEIRDRVLPTPPLVPYQHIGGSQSSSRGSLNIFTPGLAGDAEGSRSSSRQHDESRDSPTIPHRHARASSQQSYYHYSRPPSNQRYSPSAHRHSSGAASPDNGPRSIMSTSLASIDSEGSWLSGKLNARPSVQQMSPIRTSASSLRKMHQELDQEANMAEDDYFSGVEKPNKEPSVEGDTRSARLELEGSEDGASIDSAAERNMWREGLEKKVVVEEQPTHLRAMSRQGMLNAADDESPLIEGSEDYATPLEHPAGTTTETNSPFETPLEHPSKGVVEFGGR